MQQWALAACCQAVVVADQIIAEALVMVASKREFRQQVLSHLLPYLESHGFKNWKPSGRSDVPAVYLERHRQGKRDLIDIQFDKHGRLAFFVNLASLDGESVETMFEGIMPVKEVTTAHLYEQCRLVGGRMSQAFKPGLLSRLGSVSRAAEQTATFFIRSFDEAQEWFEDGTVGLHILTYRL